MGLPKSPRPTDSGSTACRSASTLMSASTQASIVVLVAERHELVGVADHPAWHVVDHLERRAGTESSLRIVTARATGTAVSASAADHLVLAGHVVRRRRQPVQRRAAQHPLGGVVEDQERQVGAAAGDQLGLQLTGARDADGAQVLIEGAEVKTVQRRGAPGHGTCLPPSDRRFAKRSPLKIAAAGPIRAQPS